MNHLVRTYAVQQDVRGLEVSVDDGPLGVVEEGEPPGGAQGDHHPRRPRQRRRRL